jgi:hypothetical protein
MKLPIDYHISHWTIRKEARQEYIKRQNGLCSHCGKLLTELPAPHIRRKTIDRSLFPANFFNWPVHLHHSHTTGLTIGAVHNLCNAVLWQYHEE